MEDEDTKIKDYDLRSLCCYAKKSCEKNHVLETWPIEDNNGNVRRTDAKVWLDLLEDPLVEYTYIKCFLEIILSWRHIKVHSQNESVSDEARDTCSNYPLFQFKYEKVVDNYMQKCRLDLSFHLNVWFSYLNEKLPLYVLETHQIGSWNHEYNIHVCTVYNLWVLPTSFQDISTA